MSDQKTSPVDYGFQGRLNWVISGAVSGVAGAMALGAFFGVIYPDVVSVTIPSLYGVESGRSTGWALHLMHGLVLGVIFGFLVTRELFLDALMVNTEMRFLASYGLSTRLTPVGVVYGLMVWISLPLVALPILVFRTGGADPEFPAATVESLIGHLIFGGTLGFILSIFINISTKTEGT